VRAIRARGWIDVASTVGVGFSLTHPDTTASEYNKPEQNQCVEIIPLQPWDWHKWCWSADI
jgi:hypothetical protein